jgi:hypothetical protein
MFRYFLATVPLLLLAAVQSQAAVLYATGFEQPSFVPGSIDGQAGWFVFSASGQTSVPVVETTVVKTGAQAVGVPGSVNGQTGPVFAPNFTNPVLDLSADIFLASSTSQSAWQFATTGANDTGYAGGIDINGTSIAAITSGFPVVGTFTRDAWHHIDVVLDYVSQTFGLDLDGSTLANNLPFCGNNFGPCNGAPVAELGWALFNTFGNGNDTGFMDNFSIATVPAAVPEPASITLIGIAILGLGATLRRRMPNPTTPNPRSARLAGSGTSETGVTRNCDGPSAVSDSRISSINPLY